MEEQLKSVFQSDSEIVNHIYCENKNYEIDYNHSIPKKYCVIYFSSNNIYFPNNKMSFEKSVILKNRYEWKKLKLTYAHKHIFIRDIKKQWYLTGINNKINSPLKMVEFLKKETENFEIICIGSSAGGYAAVLYGQLLNATRIYSFNGQFELHSLLRKSSEQIDPIVFRNRNNLDLIDYYGLKNFISNPNSIYYFVSIKSEWDKEQYNYLKHLNLNITFFNTSHHGIPFLKISLKKLLMMNKEELYSLKNKTFNPIIFSFKLSGIAPTLGFLFQTSVKKLIKIF